MRIFLISIIASTQMQCASYIPTTANQLSQMEHPDNQWMPNCYSPSYAQCGRDSLKNRQDRHPYQ